MLNLLSFSPLSKEEKKVTVLILFVLLVAIAINLGHSERKARDNQRKQDIRNIASALSRYNDDFAAYPPAIDGRIGACGNAGALAGCRWGEDAILDISDPAYPPYLVRIPVDPQNSQGIFYLYLSNEKRFQLFASLEGEDEAEYNPRIVARNLSCGVKLCNFGLSGGTPLEKSIEEYENEINEEK